MMWQDTDCERLEAWRRLLIRTVQGPRYDGYKDDVAHEKILMMIERANRGLSIPPCPPRLIGRFRAEAFRRAKKLSGWVGGSEGQATGMSGMRVELNDPADVVDQTDDPRLDEIKLKFGESAYQSMIETTARDGIPSLRELASACGMPERTFRAKRKKFKDEAKM